MKTYYGNILIGTIENKQLVFVTKKDDSPTFIPINETNIRFVHYPDCQQLIIWLPHPGMEYGNIRLIKKNPKKIIGEWPVADRLSGSIQILWDTLPIAPGTYKIEIDWKDGWQHIIELEKQKKNAIVPKGRTDNIEKVIVDLDAKPIQYRDGFGRVIVDEDLVLREKLNKDLTKKFSRRIEFEGTFRSGKVSYIDSEVSIDFYHEMGGGNCMFYIEIPTEEQWESKTKTNLSSRKEILEYLAATVKMQQAANSRYEINNDSIIYYNK